MSLISRIHQVNHPPTCTSIYHSWGALKVFWFTNLSWHIAGFVTKLIVKLQNAQVAYCSALMKNLMQQALSGDFAKYNTRENFNVYSMQSHTDTDWKWL